MLALFLLKRVDCNDGVASHIETLVSGLAQRGWRVVMATGDIHGHEVARQRYNSIKNAIVDWIVINNFRQPAIMIRTIGRIADVTDRYDVDLIHVHGLSLLPYAALLRWKTGRKFVASYHPSAHSGDPRKIRTSLSFATIAGYAAALHGCRPDRIIAFSSEIFELFTRSCGYPESKVDKIFLGIDTRHFRPPNPSEREAARRRLGIEPGDVAVVLPGRLNWNKGHDLLIASARELAARRPHVSFRYIFPGAGAQEESIRDAAARASSDRGAFLFPGFVDDMRSIFFAADMAVLPSRHEGFGLVVAEAMACGLPVIRTPSGGFEDQIVEGKNGFAIPFNDAAALTARIGDLLDASVRRRMSSAALERSKLFDSEEMVMKTAALYVRVASETRFRGNVACRR
jgi:glycosyltransferase involved in cell wall biosynthesis